MELSPESTSAAKRLLTRIAFVFSLAVFATLIGLNYWSTSRAKRAIYWTHRSNTIVHQLDDLMQFITDAETGQRGYIITGNSEYLTPYNRALRNIPSLERSLQELTQDNPSQHQRMTRLGTLLDSKLGELKATIDIRTALGMEAARKEVMKHLGINLMVEIRKLADEAEDAEELLLNQRRAERDREMDQTLLALITGGVVGFALLLWVYFQRNAAEAALTARNRDLEKARKSEHAQGWIKAGLNELNSKVREDQPVAEICHNALSFLSGYLKAGSSALYLFDPEIGALRLTAQHALTSTKASREVVGLGDGLAGEAAREQRTMLLNNVPADYFVIGSALGEAAPGTVAAVPLMHDRRLVGVMELATFGGLGELELDLLGQSAEVLAVAVSVNQTRQRVNELLQQSQAQEEELRVQQEELQQNNEELEERTRMLELQREEIAAKNLEMAEAGRNLMQKAREIEQVSSYKSQFLANMSHELRTPLNSLMILAAHLQQNREGNLTAKQVEYASNIRAAGGDLLNLINDILDLSKVEAGRIEFRYESVQLAELLQQLSVTVKPLAEQKGLQFVASMESGTPPFAILDLQRTLQVLNNLVSNGVKFTPEGSVTVRISPAGEENPLRVPALAFAVIDTGIGIAHDKHELIFQAFRQGDGSTSRKFGGTGLGLSIARELARGMGGEIVLRGAEGEGSTFTLYLPLDRRQKDSAAAAMAPRGLPQPPRELPPSADQPLPLCYDDRERAGGGERCILIIEDDPIFARLLVERVRERGFAAIVAQDGETGIQLAERYHPSAIVLDVVLRGLDGWGVMQKLKENVAVRHIPVHFVTCLEERHKALAMGAVGFISKPVSAEQLDQVFGTLEEAASNTMRKLLIVEDDPTHAQALVTLLEERSVAITVAQSGGRAIELLAGETFDCIVLDLGLADMSGFELLETMRSMEEQRRIPVIIHTGKEISGEENLRLRQYAESVIIKGAKSPERLLNEVTLFLHVMESKLPPEKRRMIRSTLDTEAGLSGKKVLLADDDMRNIFSLSSVLSDKGMRVVEAENGRVALELLQEHPDVDLILMDVMMPEMDGFEATREIRQDPRFARLPIIALTAKAMKGDREACLQAGASDYITKPVEIDRLTSLMKLWLFQHD